MATIFPFNLKNAEMCCRLKEDVSCYIYYFYLVLERVRKLQAISSKYYSSLPSQ